MRRIRIVLAILLLTAVSLLTGSPTATAAPPGFGPPVALAAGCTPVAGAADATIAANGTVRGFVSCGTAQAPTIWYFVYRGSTRFAQPTPYHGLVVKAAWDGLASTYLLFSRPGSTTPSQQLLLGKHLDNTSGYSATTLLTTTFPAGLKRHLPAIQAGLVADHGQWWAIWTEPVGGAGSEPVYSLFQRHTLLGTQPRIRMTYPSGGAQDYVPTLAYSHNLMTAVWLRGAPATGRGRVTLGVNTGRGWTARYLPGSSPITDPIGYPDLISYVNARYLTWLGSGAVGVGVTVTGPFAPRLFPAQTPRVATVAISGTNLFVFWSGPQGVVRLTERTAGAWTVPATVAGASRVVRVLAQDSRARLVYLATDGKLMLVEQNAVA